jgi:hypothetical protein
MDMNQYYNQISASNSAHNLIETKSLHETIKKQVEETAELHMTIRSQIENSNKQECLIWRLSIIVAILALIQTIGTVIQAWSIFK